MQVLTDSVIGDCKDQEKEDLIRQFRQIVGSITILFDFLSAAALAKLLDEEKEIVCLRLGDLHSVLDVPESQDSPIWLLYLFFHDFLLDKQ